LESVEIVHRLRRARGRGEYRLGIVLQELQPVREILRVVGAHILRDAKLGAQEGGADPGHKFLDRALS
jgi:hypothetical protein